MTKTQLAFLESHRLEEVKDLTWWDGCDKFDNRKALQHLESLGAKKYHDVDYLLQLLTYIGAEVTWDISKAGTITFTRDKFRLFPVVEEGKILYTFYDYIFTDEVGNPFVLLVIGDGKNTIMHKRIPVFNRRFAAKSCFKPFITVADD